MYSRFSKCHCHHHHWRHQRSFSFIRPVQLSGNNVWEPCQGCIDCFCNGNWPWHRFDAKLTYTLREQDREHFYISSIEATNTGVLKVFKVTQLIDGTKRPLMVWPCRGPIAAVDAVILYIYRKSTCYRLTRIVSQEYWPMFQERLCALSIDVIVYTRESVPSTAWKRLFALNNIHTKFSYDFVCRLIDLDLICINSKIKYLV